MLRLIGLTLASLALAGGAAAGGGGPSPGVVTGWDGTLAEAGTVRYVALPAARAPPPLPPSGRVTGGFSAT